MCDSIFLTAACAGKVWTGCDKVPTSSAVGAPTPWKPPSSSRTFTTSPTTTIRSTDIVATTPPNRQWSIAEFIVIYASLVVIALCLCTFLCIIIRRKMHRAVEAQEVLLLNSIPQ